MIARKTVNLDCIYFDATTEGTVTATVEAWWAPSRRLAFVEMNAYDRDAKGRVSPIVNQARRGPRGEPVTLDRTIRVLMSPTENEIGDVVRAMKAEWHEIVGRATGKIPPNVAPVKKTAG